MQVREHPWNSRFFENPVSDLVCEDVEGAEEQQAVRLGAVNALLAN